MNFLYLWVNLFSVLVPFAFSFHPKLLFFRQWKSALPAIAICALLFILWDIYFTKLGIWGFSPSYITGIFIFNLPLEEVLFFVCIPYCCLFTYHCLKILIEKDHFHKYQDHITLFLLIFLLYFGIMNTSKLYTSFTFFGLSLALVFIRYLYKPEWLSRFYFVYIVLLIPFFIVNGILTGTGLDHPVVWYNNLENLKIRILTIPFEDFFYGMLLILLNVFVYEHLNRKNAA